MTSIQSSHRVLRRIVLVLAISAIAAPAASARLDPPPTGTAQSQTAPASLVVRPNPDQQTGRTGSSAQQSLRPARVSEPAVHHRVHVLVKHASASALGTGNTPRGVAIAMHPLKPTVNDHVASTGTFEQTHSSLEHALYRPNSPGAGGASLATLTAIANASAAAPGAVAPPAITAPSDDFDYGAAALGAGITAAIALLIAAGTLGLRQRTRARHP
jgi:hypothetical protein